MDEYQIPLCSPLALIQPQINSCCSFLFHLTWSHFSCFSSYSCLTSSFSMPLQYQLLFSSSACYFSFYILLVKSSFILPVLYPASDLFLSILLLNFLCSWRLFHKLLKYNLLPFTQQFSSHQVLTKLLCNVSLGYHSREKVTSCFVTIAVSFILQNHCSSASLSAYFPQFQL